MPKSTAGQRIKEVRPSRELTRLIRRSMAGSETAFHQLYLRFLQEIHYTVAGLLDRPEDTDDVTQEVVIALWKGLGRLQSPYAFFSYLYQTTRYVCYGHNRKQGVVTVNAEDVLGELVADEVHSPEMAFSRRELEEEISALMQQLPEKQRTALVLYYYHGLKYREIAAVLGSTVTSVSTNLMKAKKAFSRLVEQSVAADTSLQATPGSDEDAGYDRTLAPVVITALSSSFAESLPAAEAALLADSIAARLATLAAATAAQLAAVASEAAASSPPAGIVAAVALCAVLLVGGGCLAYRQAVLGLPEAQDRSGIAATLATPKVQIVFDCTDPAVPTSFNPTSASLQTSTGHAGEWSVAAADNTVVARGSGSQTNLSFNTLPEGDYLLRWEIWNGQRQLGVAERAFVCTAERQSV